MEHQLLTFAINSIIESEDRWISKLSNVSAAIFQYMDRLNWAGFYLWDESKDELYLGPFQGKMACTKINIKHGVCGKAVRENRVQRVEDVHAFEGHIACDSDSESEIVLPLRKDGKIWGVLDIDSPIKGRFSEQDEEFLLQIAERIGEAYNTMEQNL